MSRLRPRFVFAAFLCVAAPAVWWLADRYTAKAALAQLEAQADQIARQHLQLIDSELARFRLLPVVLSDYGDIGEVLSGAPGADAIDFSARLASLAAETGAPVIYAMDADGLALASSNYDQPESFIGSSFAFRPYFDLAMQARRAEYYGAGLVSGRAGLFFAHRVEGGTGPLGVVVVKYEFDDLLTRWREDPGTTLITDPNGVVLSATDPAASLTLLHPLNDAGRADIIASGRFPGFVETAGPWQRDSAGTWSQAGTAAITASRPIAGTALELVHLMDPAPVVASARRQGWLITVQVVALLAAAGLFIVWRMARAARAAEDRRALERAVEERTADLRLEMAERARVDLEIRQARDELAQANRLASLGQISAGLAHEVNQPVATIRTLAENAQHHLTAGRQERVSASLANMVELTTRIGSITSGMRRFARPGEVSPGPVSLDSAIAGVQLILGDRLRRSGCRLDLPEPGLRVTADLTRLEQVLVNLVQNALDALEGRPAPQISLIACREGETVTLLVADNGPGLPPDLADTIFHPFVTGKPGGLGLGLAISRDIMRGMGGELDIAASPLGGAGFVIRMRAA